MFVGDNNRVSQLVVATIALVAFLPALVDAEGTCCIICPESCIGFGLNDDFSDTAPVTGSKVECMALGYPSFRMTDGTCLDLGLAPVGDCWQNDDCTGSTDPFGFFSDAPRQSLDFCEANGYLSIRDFYSSTMGESICYTVAELRALFPAIRTGTTEGDPHIKTWGGKWFDYHGECDLVMVDVPQFEKDTPLKIHIRTTIRYGYSFIESAAMKLGDDLFEVSSHGQYSWNGISQVDLEEATMSLYPIHHRRPTEKQHIFDIVVGKNENITISTFKDLVSVKVTSGNIHHYGSTRGLMGNFGGKMYARDGKTLMDADKDPNAIGQEWQVRADEPMLFQRVRAPQASKGQKCKLPDPKALEATTKRRLGEAKVDSKAAEFACNHLEGKRKDNCIFDVIAIGDLKLAGAY